MWRGWSFPVVNPQQLSEEESFGSAESEGGPSPTELVSPRRPPQSPNASPRALLQPDPPQVDEVLASVNSRLRNLPDRQRRAEERAAAAAANMPANPPVPFERENGDDDANALRESCRSLEKLEWDDNDIKFFFNRAETRMKLNGAKKQYTKFQILSEILPKKVQDEVKELLSQTEDEFINNDAYLQLKTEVLRIFGPKPEDSIERALNRVLVGKPSQLARALVSDICKQNPKLECPCCPAVVGTLWKRQLSSAVRAGIAHSKFNKENFNEIVQLADDIHADTAPASAAASVAAVRQNLDETQPAIPYPTQVAAVRGGGNFRGNRGGNSGGRGQSRGGGNNRGGGGASGGSGRGGGNGSRFRGTKHPDLPQGEWKGCAMHFRWGRGAFFCAQPSTCPWRDITTPKPEK